MKNIYRLMVIGVVFLVLSLTAFAVAKTRFFPDVEKGSWYESAVNNLSDMGVINGYPNGKFGPNDKVSRAELAKVLDTYNQSNVEPLKYQIGRFHQKGRKELMGASWKKYAENMNYYPLYFSLGDEGEPPYDKNEDYFGKIPSNFVAAYDHTKKLDGITYGMKIIAYKDWKTASATWFYIWEKDL